MHGQTIWMGWSTLEIRSDKRLSRLHSAASGLEQPAFARLGPHGAGVYFPDPRLQQLKSQMYKLRPDILSLQLELILRIIFCSLCSTKICYYLLPLTGIHPCKLILLSSKLHDHISHPHKRLSAIHAVLKSGVISCYLRGFIPVSSFDELYTLLISFPTTLPYSLRHRHGQISFLKSTFCLVFNIYFAISSSDELPPCCGAGA